LIKKGEKMISLKNKVALITGASRGIGKETALLFAHAGANVVVNYYKNEREAEIVVNRARRHKVKAFSFQADVGSYSDLKKLFDFTMGKFKRIDILINNAGIWEYAKINKIKPAELKKTLKVNLEGVFYLTQMVSDVMIRQRSGNIINISSTAGQRGEPFHSHYAASKGAIISLTKSLAVELAPYNIRVNCAAPGWVDTDMSRKPLREEKDEILRVIPMRRAAKPEEIAGPILFLASDLSSFITGEILNVNGGAVLCG
jgi:3-oxoacyl-[acyl-carrier protein] reductase